VRVFLDGDRLGLAFLGVDLVAVLVEHALLDQAPTFVVELVAADGVVGRDALVLELALPDLVVVIVEQLFEGELGDAVDLARQDGDRVVLDRLLEDEALVVDDVAAEHVADVDVHALPLEFGQVFVPVLREEVLVGLGLGVAVEHSDLAHTFEAALADKLELLGFVALLSQDLLVVNVQFLEVLHYFLKVLVFESEELELLLEPVQLLLFLLQFVGLELEVEVLLLEFEQDGVLLAAHGETARAALLEQRDLAELVVLLVDRDHLLHARLPVVLDALEPALEHDLHTVARVVLLPEEVRLEEARDREFVDQLRKV